MINLFEKIRLLKESSMFSEVDTDDLRYVAELLQDEICFKDERIFEVNDYGDEMYIITSGKIGISIENRDNEYISILSVGDCFGEMNLLDGLPRSATACVIEDSQLLSLSKSNFRGLVLNYPAIGLGLMRSLSLRLRHTNKQTGIKK